MYYIPISLYDYPNIKFKSYDLERLELKFKIN